MASKRLEQTRERVKVELLQRQSAEKEALSVVMKLLEHDVTEEQLTSSVRRLNPQYYRDATEERGLALYCGYPICNNKLKALNHKQKYHISTHHNKVYDVSERKYFCSSDCFKASKYLESQLSEEPLWMRGDNFRCDVQLMRAGSSTAVDGSVVIDTNTVFIDPRKDGGDALAEDILEKLKLAEDLKEPVDSILDEEELSEDNSSCDETIQPPPAGDLLKSRKHQRLNTVRPNTNKHPEPSRTNKHPTTTDINKPRAASQTHKHSAPSQTHKHSAASNADKHTGKSPAVNSEPRNSPDWQGSMLSRLQKNQVPERGCITLNVEESMALSHKHAPDNSTSAQTSRRSDYATKSPNSKQLSGRGSESAPRTARTVLLDTAASGGGGSHSNVHKHRNSGQLQTCVNRLNEWFVDGTRRSLFSCPTLFRDTAESTPSASETESTIQSTNLVESRSANETSDKSAEDEYAFRGDEVEVIPPNVESVITKQRGIVFHRILKSYERVGSVLPDSAEFRDKLGDVIKTLRLNRDNVVARPMEWDVITLLLSLCVYNSDTSTAQRISDEVRKLTGEDETDQILNSFLRQQTTANSTKSGVIGT